ncbi:hypothetical protein FVEN_g778 [Fusarium venenatum]|uniref:Uncharacterized protein n=2 Tax=Fusarium venenatum TaxID=56646 RepID=A0A2L2TKW5_9HYPO|nr:uncharacterized protein FVRRES_10816 [Fusarium venenatum]KAG8361220.1 hypothetical protein FVEN_g778 [Fusarium venenatum]CEI70739.1 unnamed protein product [Fusarium venenatum]
MPHNGPPEVCNVTTPGNIKLTTHHSPTTLQTIFRSNATRITSGDLTKSLGDLVRIAVYKSRYDEVSFNTTGINITECSIGFTAYEYKGAEANGSVFMFGDLSEIHIEGVDWAWEPVPSGEARQHIVSNRSTTPELPSFRISGPDIWALWEFFESIIFQGEYMSGGYKSINSGLNAALGGDADVENAFKNMAQSMTDYIRSGPSSKRAVGDGIEFRNFGSINWPWLIGPAILELAALIFAVCTIMATTRKHEVPLWKSSALVLLNAEYDKNAGTINGEFEGVKELEKMAKSSKARLD